MKLPNTYWTRILVVGALAMFAPHSLHAEVQEKTRKVGNATVNYKIVLPSGYDPAKAYPAILTLGGGHRR